MADEFKSFRPKGNAPGFELSYAHPEKDGPVTIKKWPHVAQDAYEERFLDNHEQLTDRKASDKQADSGKED